MKVEDLTGPVTPEETEPVAGSEEVAAEGAGATQETEEEVIVTLGEEPPPEPEENRAPEWVRELRKKHRETVKELADAKKKLESMTAESKPAELAKKPTLEDVDYDAELYETRLAEWFEAKRRNDDEQAKAKAAEDAANADWQSKVDAYGKAKESLKFEDIDEAEAEAMNALSPTQQGIIVKGAKNPAVLIYALGKDHKELAALAAIKDPVDFTFAVARLEVEKLKVTKRTPAPPPEKIVTGTGRVSGTIDSTLERLRADAEKTGDYSKVLQYKRQKKNT